MKRSKKVKSSQHPRSSTKQLMKQKQSQRRTLHQFTATQSHGKGALWYLLITFVLSLGVLGYGYITAWLSPPAFDGLYIHLIDVGQGDATLLQTPTAALLIDGGDNHMGTRLLSYLQAQGVSHLDYVIATHPHADHTGGLIPVLQQLSVGTVMMPGVVHTTQTFERLITALEQSNARVVESAVGETLYLGDAVLTVVAPHGRGYASLNDYSIVLHMVYGRLTALFAADAEAVSEREMLAGDHPLSAYLLRVGHHGSHTSTTADFLAAVDPAIAVVSVGADNRYGHPHDSVMDRLQAHGATIYRTDRDGHVVFRTDGVTLERVSP